MLSRCDFPLLLSRRFFFQQIQYSHFFPSQLQHWLGLKVKIIITIAPNLWRKKWFYSHYSQVHRIFFGLYASDLDICVGWNFEDWAWTDINSNRFSKTRHWKWPKGKAKKKIVKWIYFEYNLNNVFFFSEWSETFSFNGNICVHSNCVAWWRLSLGVIKIRIKRWT